MSYTERPPRATMLYALEVPMENGVVLGDTLFSSAADAHDSLPREAQERIAGPDPFARDRARRAECRDDLDEVPANGRQQALAGGEAQRQVFLGGPAERNRDGSRAGLVQAKAHALEGLGQLMRTLDLVRDGLNPTLRVGGVVLTMFDARTKLAEQVVAEVRKHFGDAVFRSIIPRSVRLSEAPGFGKPIIRYDPGSRASTAYRELAAETRARWPMARAPEQPTTEGEST